MEEDQGGSHSVAETLIGTNKNDIRPVLKKAGLDEKPDWQHKGSEEFIRGVIAHVSEPWFTAATKVHRLKCAKEGIFDWKPGSASVLFELGLAPPPHKLQWCYRIRMVGVGYRNKMVVSEFWLPQEEIAKAGKAKAAPQFGA